MNNLNNILDYLKVFNNIDKKSEPRFMAPTGMITEYGRKVYETSGGEKVSEKSVTLQMGDTWINVPSIHGGKMYNQAQLEQMLMSGKIQPTSTVHNSEQEAVDAAMSRSDTMQSERVGYKDGTSKKQLSFDFKAKKKPTTVGEATIDFIVEKGRQPKPSEVLQIKEKLKKSVTNILTQADIKCKLANGINCNDPRAYIKSINELKSKAALGDKAAFTKFKKVANAMRKLSTPARLTGWGILGEIGFALPFAAMDYADGKSTAQIMNNASMGLFGMNEEEEAISLLPKDSQGGAVPSLLRAGERIEKLEDPNRVFRQPRIGMDENSFRKRQAKVIADAELDFKDKLEPFLEGPRNEYYNPEKSAKAFGDFAKAEDKLAAMEEQKAKERAVTPFEGIEFKEGGRVSFKLGGMGRRGFLKLLAALGIGGATAGTGLIKFGSKAVGKKAAVKTGVDIVSGTQGMPSWFPSLVNKIIKEGDDVTTKLATQERQVVHTKKLPDGEQVTVHRDLDTGDIRVEYDSVYNMGEGTAPVQMEYKAGQVIDEGKSAGKKTDPEFSAAEPEPRYERTTPDDAEVNWDFDNQVGNVDDLMSDTSKIKNYAESKKPTIKEIVTRKRKTDEVNKINTDEGAQVDYSVNKYGDGPDIDLDYDFASGGRVSYFDGGIVSLKKKW